MLIPNRVSPLETSADTKFACLVSDVLLLASSLPRFLHIPIQYLLKARTLYLSSHLPVTFHEASRENAIPGVVAIAPH